MRELFLNNRMKSFYWRSGMMFIAAFLDIAVETLTTLAIPTEVVVILGLIFGEVSKYIRNRIVEDK